MNYVIFGTGKYFLDYYDYLDNENVLFLVDNDQSKWGKSMKGKLVYPPQSADWTECDFILILVRKYENIIKQLLSYGIERSRIKLYYDLPNLLNLHPQIVSRQGVVDFDKWERKCDLGSVLVCSHEFSRTGVPIALMHLCKLLRNMGYNVLFSSLEKGNLEYELGVEEIDYVKDLGLFYKNEICKNMIRSFDFIFLGSVATSDFANEISDMKIPIIWWLHESSDIAYLYHPLIIKSNIYYLGGGKRVLQKFKEHYPNGIIKELLYFLPNDEIEERKRINDKMIFALAGTIERRKGQDIFIEAIKQLPGEIISKTEFFLIGTYRDKQYFKAIEGDVINNKHIRWVGELSQEELREQYRSIDVLVCPSRDDPMPIVVTQALQNGIPCIVSDEVGQKEYFAEGKGGSVFPSENSKELAKYICRYVQDAEMVAEKSVQAKNIFNEHFSESAMKENLITIINNIRESD